jgi:hypothetical protein
VKTFLAADIHVRTGQPNPWKERYAILTHRTCSYITAQMIFLVNYGLQLVRTTSIRVELRRKRNPKHLQGDQSD